MHDHQLVPAGAVRVHRRRCRRAGTAWGSALRPHGAGRATAALFIALTAGQAVGAAATGALAQRTGTLAQRTGAPAALLVCAAVTLLAALVLPTRAGASRSAP